MSISTFSTWAIQTANIKTKAISLDLQGTNAKQHYLPRLLFLLSVYPSISTGITI
jgi:hypothetical protein